MLSKDFGKIDGFIANAGRLPIRVRFSLPSVLRPLMELIHFLGILDGSVEKWMELPRPT